MSDIAKSLDLVGIYEIAEIAGCSKPAVSRWKKTLPDFPEPAAELRAGPVFWREQIVNWLAKRAATASVRSFKSEMIVEPITPGATRVRNVRKSEPIPVEVIVPEPTPPREPYVYPQRKIGQIITEDDLI